MNVGLERVWKEVVIAPCKALSQNLLGDPQENHEK